MEAASDDNGESNVIALTSGSHAQLFYHDLEIVNLFQEPLSNANAHIQHLEQRLRQSVQDGHETRHRLYAVEIALQNALSCRKAFERHLQLEQYESRLLREKHDKVTGEMDAILTCNEMLRLEVEHQQQIIESMTARLATHEGEATNPSGCPPSWWDSGPLSSQGGRELTAATPRPGSASDEPQTADAVVQSGLGKGSASGEKSKTAKTKARPKAP